MKKQLVQKVRQRESKNIKGQGDLHFQHCTKKNKKKLPITCKLKYINIYKNVPYGLDQLYVRSWFCV